MFNPVKNTMWPTACAQNFGDRSTRHILNYVKSRRNDKRNLTKIKVLFLGCGDIKNVLQAVSPVTSNSGNKLDIHAHEDNAFLMARNIFILQTISSHDFKPERDVDLAFLWDVWYNVDWPETTRTRFLAILESLFVSLGSLPQNVVISDVHYVILKEVWTTWKTTLINNVSTDEPFVIQDSSNEGKKKFAKFEIGTDDLHEAKQKNVCEEANQYMRHGSCRIVNNARIVCANPAMFDHSFVSSSTPFEAYLPLDIEEIVDVDNKILISSCLQILKKLVITYRNCRKAISITFYLEDAVSFCFPMKCMEKYFHVIYCSKKTDLGLVNLILACRSRMVDDEGGLLFTDLIEFNTFRVPDVESLLCCSVSMMPTIYGFRLLDHQFGFHNSTHFNAKPILCWQKQPQSFQLPMVFSEVFQKYFQLLARMCCNKKMGCLNNSEKDKFKMDPSFRHSPYTFHYVLDSFNQRIRKNDWWKAADLSGLDIDARFNLTWKTLEIWKDGTQELTVYTCRMQSKRSTYSDSSLLRLVCLHRDNNEDITVESTSDIHFIDNFSFGTNDTDFSTTIKFLLPSDAIMEKTYRVILWDVINGLLVEELGTLTTMSKEKSSFIYPFKMSAPNSAVSSSETQIVLKSCIESTTDFNIKLTFDERLKNVLGNTLDTNEKDWSDSCTEIALSWNQTTINRTTISLPYPIFVEDIVMDPHQDEGYIDLLLKKALNEPWPCGFQLGYRTVSSDLKPWMMNENRLTELNNSLDNHLSRQFLKNLLDPVDPEESNDSQSRVRKTIRFLLTSYTLYEKFKIKSIKIVSPTRDEDWLHLVFKHPILTTPQGTPILITSVYDNKRARLLKKKEKLNLQATDQRLMKWLQVEKERDMKTDTQEDFELIRLLLHLNATRTIPNKWQEQNLYIGDDSPWLATYISPIYAYHKPTEDAPAPSTRKVGERQESVTLLSYKL